MECSKCGVVGEEHFSPSRVREGKKRDWCRACCYARTRERMKSNPRLMVDAQKASRNRKYLYISQYKVERGCRDCGEKHPACLDLHHRDPSQKKERISKLAAENASMERIKAEMGKCDVLCANCHRKHHWAETGTVLTLEGG